jgi:hypothetical protein
MKRMMLGTLLGFLVAVAAVVAAEQRNDGFVPRGTPPVAMATPTAGSELIVTPTIVGDKTQVLTVVDPRQRVLSVYHIELATGKIALKSVRNLQWDSQIMYLNNEPPLPQEIRSQMEQR